MSSNIETNASIFSQWTYITKQDSDESQNGNIKLENISENNGSLRSSYIINKNTNFSIKCGDIVRYKKEINETKNTEKHHEQRGSFFVCSVGYKPLVEHINVKGLPIIHWKNFIKRYNYKEENNEFSTEDHSVIVLRLEDMPLSDIQMDFSSNIDELNLHSVSGKKFISDNINYAYDPETCELYEFNVTKFLNEPVFEIETIKENYVTSRKYTNNIFLSGIEANSSTEQNGDNCETEEELSSNELIENETKAIIMKSTVDDVKSLEPLSVNNSKKRSYEKILVSSVSPSKKAIKNNGGFNFKNASSFANSYQKNHLVKRTKTTTGQEGYDKKSNSVMLKKQLVISNKSMDEIDTVLDISDEQKLQVKGREKHLSKLYAKIAEFCNNGLGFSIYVAGVPGTGKTYTVRKTIDIFLKEHPNEFMSCEINVLKLIDPKDAYSNLCEKLNLPIREKDNAAEVLQKYFADVTSKSEKQRIVLVLDEIDVMLDSYKEGIYNFLNWSYTPGSQLLVIAIGNQLNLYESLDKKTQSRMGENDNKIEFEAYQTKETELILKTRLEEECSRNTIYVEKKSGKVVLFSSAATSQFLETHKSLFKRIKFAFTKQSIEYLAKLNSKIISDIRTSKGIALSAMALAEKDYINKHGIIYNYERHFFSYDNFDEVDHAPNFEEETVIVTPQYCAQASSKAKSASFKDLVKELTPVGRILIYVSITLCKKTNSNVLYYGYVIDEVDLFLMKNQEKVANVVVQSTDFMNQKADTNVFRIINWDETLNQLALLGLIEITRFSNERANKLTLKCYDELENEAELLLTQFKKN